MEEGTIYVPEGIEDIGYKTKYSAGYDICSNETLKIPPKTSKLVDTGIIVKLNNKNIFASLFIRSSLPGKKNLMMLNSVGIIDPDYCGREDSIKMNLYNFGETESVIEKGERIGQIVFLKFEKPELNVIHDKELLDENNRGGFGSTDKKTN